MSKKRWRSAEEKYEILKLDIDGVKSRKEILSEFGVHPRTLQDWRYQFVTYGIEGLKNLKTKTRYSQEMKMQVVNEVLSGEISLRTAARKYGIPDKCTVQAWLKLYNDNRELKSTPKGLNCSMVKGRTTTWRERIDIVLFCIAHERDYNQTAEVYRVSYQQVYQWVKKYDSNGEDALKDRRGRKKELEELTPEEMLLLNNKKLTVENERLRAENAFLKKLEELERRRF